MIRRLIHHPSTLFARLQIASTGNVATEIKTGYGEVESKVRFPLPHTLDGDEILTTINALH